MIDPTKEWIIVRKEFGDDSWKIENYGDNRLVIHGDLADALAEGQADINSKDADVWLVEVKFVHKFQQFRGIGGPPPT